MSLGPFYYEVRVLHGESGVERLIYVTAPTGPEAEIKAIAAAARDASYFGEINNIEDYASMSYTAVTPA